MLNFSPSCERNKQVILEQLTNWIKPGDSVFEIGSLSGQHAIHFCQQLVDVKWKCSDIGDNLAALTININDAELNNCLTPVELTLGQAISSSLSTESYQTVFSANTLHIVAWPLVEDFFVKAGHLVAPNGFVIVYGPFKYQGQYTSASNADFNVWLKDRDTASGIRDFEAVNQLAHDKQLSLIADMAMPANNQLLVWQKLS